jgi:flavin reductase (DIM6/NTAB) family NADH-FMN oxidoreductase RutF
MTFDPRNFRDALGSFATGVTIVTGRNRDNVPVGATVSSFNSVSLDPPLVLFSLDQNSETLGPLKETGQCLINVLAEGQEDLSNKFAKSGAISWEGVDFQTWDTGCPVLLGSLANFECTVFATHPGGDHEIFVAQVKRYKTNGEGRPLLFHGGRYGRLAD